MKFEIKLIKSTEGKTINWVFLPGGPGLGSETLLPLIQELDVQGKCWLADYPYNSDANTIYDYNQWSNDLIDLVRSMQNVVVVGHSFGGMLTLSIPNFEKEIIGLVLLTSAPICPWLQDPKYSTTYQLPDTSTLQNEYVKNPSNELLKKFILASAPCFFTEKSMEKGIQFLESLPYNHRPYDWAMQHFQPNFRYQWVPENIPTIILSGELDPLTPLVLFENENVFQRDNIKMYLIKESGHFPWFENMDAIKMVMSNFQNDILVPCANT